MGHAEQVEVGRHFSQGSNAAHHRHSQTSEVSAPEAKGSESLGPQLHFWPVSACFGPGCSPNVAVFDRSQQSLFCFALAVATGRCWAFRQRRGSMFPHVQRMGVKFALLRSVARCGTSIFCLALEPSVQKCWVGVGSSSFLQRLL